MLINVLKSTRGDIKSAYISQLLNLTWKFWEFYSHAIRKPLKAKKYFVYVSYEKVMSK